MSNPFRNYTDLLALRQDTVQRNLDSSNAAAGLKLLFVIVLIAGLGLWFGIPIAMSTPTVTERIDMGIVSARETSASVVAAVLPVVTNAQSASEAAIAVIQQQTAGIQAQVQALLASVNGMMTSGQARVAEAAANSRVQALLQQATVTKEQVEQAVAEGPVSREQLTALLARANVTPEQATAVLQQAGISQADLQQTLADVQTQVQTQVQARVQSQVQAGVDAASSAALAQLRPMLQNMGVTEEQFNTILSQLETTPAQFNQLLQTLSLTPQFLGNVVKQVEATPEQLEQLAADIRAESVKAEPVIGTRPSRLVHLFGQWLSAPLQLASDWLLFALVLLIAAKLLGGRATLPKHIGAMALAAAPLVLLLGLYMPDLSNTLPPAMAGALYYFGRLLALIGLVWGGLLLLRTLSLAHGMSLWRTVGAIALAWAGLYIVLPLAGLLATGFLLR